MIIASPLAGIAADELIDPHPGGRGDLQRYIGSSEFSNLPRKFKTAITGNPSLDVAPEVNDLAFVPSCIRSTGPASTCGSAAVSRRTRCWPRASASGYRSQTSRTSGGAW